MSWKENAIMYFSDDNGSNWHKITDHNRQPLNITYNRIENSNRMANGTLRRYSIAKKRQFSTNWENIPSIAVPSGNGMGTVDGGFGGEDLRDWHDDHDGAFLLRLRTGQDINKDITDGTIEEVTVMITDFSAEKHKRGPNVDLWNVNLTLEEV
jgi:hypothetical protein